MISIITIIIIISGVGQTIIKLLNNDLPVALDGNVGLETPEVLAAEDDRLNSKGSRKADCRPLGAAASAMSDTLCR